MCRTIISKIHPSVMEIMTISLLLRVGFMLYGLYQDEYMDLPYTDIDYYVFTDAARFVSKGLDPYMRATYRYTPLLSWILVPTAWKPSWFWFQFGKVLFIVCDLVTGYLILRFLKEMHKNLNWSLIWLFNPMVITISTRGSSESVLTVLVMSAVYCIIRHQNALAGFWLGLAIHFKIYPFLYIPAMALFVDYNQSILRPITWNRVKFGLTTVITFLVLTYAMYLVYGETYLDQAFFYHLRRLDHRHNFSIYNLSLYFTSYTGESALFGKNGLTLEKLAFLPQLALSAILIPLRLCYKNGDAGVLISTLFAQTFTFITYNKVITSQYFIWFMCFLPLYLSVTTIKPINGIILLIGWIITQGLWLWYGYRLEFLGEFNVFHIGLWTSTSAFFLWNCYMIGAFVSDIRAQKELIQNKKVE